MASLTKTLASVPNRPGPRPFDIRHDLGKVADLVELCFADTLDPGGREYLARMRALARKGSMLSFTRGWSSAPMTGFVWEEDGQIIGNVSLIPFFVKSRRYFLIANVAVHPTARRQGIARKLTEVAIEFVHQRDIPAVWLHVRAENQAALDLYQSLDFIQKAVRTTWLADPAPAGVENLPGVHLSMPSREHWTQLKEWLNRAYPLEYSWHLPYHLTSLRSGILGEFTRLFYNIYLRQWALIEAGRLQACAAWQAADAHTNFLWLAAPLQADPINIRLLLEYILQHAPTRRALSLEYPAYQFDQAIQEAGFTEQQTLVWMELALMKN